MSCKLNEIVTISILTFNRSLLLKKLLLSLKDLKYELVEIIVVDNNSEDNTQQLIAKDFPDICYIRTDENIGAAARNLGMRAANGNIIVALDDDISNFNDSDIANIIRIFRKRPNVGAINFKVIDQLTGSVCNWTHHCKAKNYYNKEFMTYEITEGAVAFRRTVIEETGYYPEYFFLSHEGPDLAFRILDKGYEVIYSPTVSVFHSHSDLGRKNWFNYYYDTRNQFWLAARNFPIFYALFYLLRGLFSMAFYSIRDGFFLYWIRGIIDGFKGLGNTLKDRKVLNRDTMKLIKNIDKARPSVTYYIKNRILKKTVRL